MERKDDKLSGRELLRLEDSAQQFQRAIESTIGQHSPLARLFSGLMMVYWTDEADLQWVEIAMRPWFEDSAAKSENHEREIIFNVLWLCVAAQAKAKST